jgi:hypothetical protein
MKLKKLVAIETGKGVFIDLNHWTYSKGDIEIFVAMFKRDDKGRLIDLYHMPVKTIAEGMHLIARLRDINPY